MSGGGFGRMVRPFIAILVFFAVIMLLLFWALTGPIGGVLAAVVGPLALLGVLYGKYTRMESGTVVRFSEHGVELSDTMGFHLRLAWRDITRIGQVDSQMARPTPVGFRGGSLRVGVAPMVSQGIIGWGDRVIPPNAPGWMRQKLATQPVNPADGRPEVAIPLGGVDPNWLQGPMGQWIQQYRPDLLGGQWGAGHAPPAPQPGPGHPAGPGQPGYPAAPGYPPAGNQMPGQPGSGYSAAPGYPPAAPGHPPAGNAVPGQPQPGYPPPQPPGQPPYGQPYPPR